MLPSRLIVASFKCSPTIPSAEPRLAASDGLDPPSVRNTRSAIECAMANGIRTAARRGMSFKMQGATMSSLLLKLMHQFRYLLSAATCQSGYGAVCKTVYPGSIPGVASTKNRAFIICIDKAIVRTLTAKHKQKGAGGDISPSA